MAVAINIKAKLGTIPGTLLISAHGARRDVRQIAALRDTGGERCLTRVVPGNPRLWVIGFGDIDQVCERIGSVRIYGRWRRDDGERGVWRQNITRAATGCRPRLDSNRSIGGGEPRWI